MKVSSLGELYEAREYGEALFDHDFDTYVSLKSVNNWRGLFDYSSSEYNNGEHSLSVEEQKKRVTNKWVVIEKLKKLLECGLDGLVYLIANDWNTDQGCYKLRDIPDAIYEYAAYFREAEDYLMRCKHPIFREFASVDEKHWKTKFRRKLQKKLIKEKDMHLFLIDSILPPTSSTQRFECEYYDNIEPPTGWDECAERKFLDEFFASLSDNDAKWEGRICNGITPKLTVAMRDAGYILKKE